MLAQFQGLPMLHEIEGSPQTGTLYNEEMQQTLTDS